MSERAAVPPVRLRLLPNADQLFFAVCGIPDDKLVEAHGSFSTASCHLCYTSHPAAEAKVNPLKSHIWQVTPQ